MNTPHLSLTDAEVAEINATQPDTSAPTEAVAAEVVDHAVRRDVAELSASTSAQNDVTAQALADLVARVARAEAAIEQSVGFPA